MSLSVVIPVYGCGDCLVVLHQRLVAALNQITPDFEILLIDDRSPDRSWEVIRDLASADPRVRAIRLSRNFGQHATLSAGLALAKGEWTAVMDCDLQDRPEDIPRLYARAMEGYDLVLARRKRRGHSGLRAALAWGYFKSMNIFMGTELEGEFGTFSLISSQVRDAFLAFRETDRHYLFILHWLGFNRGTIEIEHDPRFSGRSSYSLGALLNHAVAGMFFQTTKLLLYIVYFGFVLAAIGLVSAACFVYLYAVAHPPPGWTSVIVMLLVVGGFIITSTGVTGLYIGRIFQQVKERPLYVIDSGAITSPDSAPRAEARTTSMDRPHRE